MKRNPLEWAILAVSVAALVAIAGYLIVQIAAGPPDAPRVVAMVDLAAGDEGATGWTAPLVVRNEGGQAARTLVIEVRGDVAGREETAVVAIDLLGATSEATVTVGFSARPAAEPAVRVVSFEVP